MKKPFVIIIDGPIGAGKSSIANLLHSKLKRTAIIRLDRIKHLISDYNQSHKDLQLASDVGNAMVLIYLQNKINVIVEKAFTKEAFLKSFIKNLKNKARIFIYQLDAPLKIRIKRVKKRPIPYDAKKRPTLKKIRDNSSHFYEFRYKKAKEFDTSKLSTKKIVNEILKDLK